MRALLGIDYGKKRIGIAISEAGIMARPLCIISNRGDRKNVAAIRAILSQSVTTSCGIVCGVALDSVGGETSLSLESRRFGELLKTELGVEVFYHNERYSSIEAQEYMRDIIRAGNKSRENNNFYGAKKSKNIKEFVDDVAAAVILNGYLNGRK